MDNISIEDKSLKKAFSYIEREVKGNVFDLKLKSSEIVFTDDGKVHKVIFNYLKNGKEVKIEEYIPVDKYKTIKFSGISLVDFSELNNYF